MKPNDNFTVKQMKDYIRSNKLNHPDVKLGMKRADMIAGLKKAGHWDSSVQKTKPTKSKPAPKKPAPKKETPKKVPPKKTKPKKEKKYEVFLLGETSGNFEKGYFVRVSKFEAKENTDPDFKNWLVIVPGVAHISKKLYEKGIRYFEDKQQFGKYDVSRIDTEFEGKETGENRVNYQFMKIDNKKTKVGFINIEPDFETFQQPRKARKLTKFIEELPGKKVPFESSNLNKEEDITYKF